MSLFEDLVEELKESNLLEETVIDSSRKVDSVKNDTEIPKDSINGNKNGSKENVRQEQPSDTGLDETVGSDDSNESSNTEGQAESGNSASDVLDFESENSDTEEISLTETDSEEDSNGKVQTEKQPVDEKEFYRQRALDEVNGLQMVEHVLTGVEREQMKSISKPYDDLNVKQSLHSFLQVCENVKSPEHAQAEFRLMQETEDWYSALTLRDRNISVSHLRRYCETTKPSLSDQALISLARFYRNSPFSESVRSKFDLVITRLFTKELEDEKRELVLEADELVRHIQELYADWASVPLYSTDEDDSELLLAALKFQDFINEAVQAESFDELVKKDFFKRLKIFKEKSSENFFSPLLVAAAIESNVAVGNRFVELLELERDKSDVTDITNKYGIVYDKTVSEATSKTLELLEILNQKKSEPVADPTSQNDSGGTSGEKNQDNDRSGIRNNLFAANKWLVFATIAVVILGAIYFIAGGPAMFDTVDTSSISKDVKVVNLDNSSLKEYVLSAKINDKTLFAITNDKWKNSSQTEKEEIVGKFISAGEEKGFEKVHMMNSNGVTVAFGSKDGVNIIE